ncbi:ferric reductase-like transmembrane domain-containing protein [Thalassococcus sp. BH17M4-6]|uniref:ferric reductase-like transmembrane domain-containing protein n=1 Tax=Thalassococcus sp. BH17M4-6 TaxID=3413148 RepID=UPI003BCF882E
MLRTVGLWAALLALLAVPVVAAAFSPYLEYRRPIYILAGFAGILGLALMPLQPLAVAGYLPGLSPMATRRLHRWVGISLLGAVALHVLGLWITSPPDVVDALLFRSPTPFSPWGVAAMWTIFAAGLLALLRGRLRLRWRTWRRWHAALTCVAVVCTVLHALLIEGTMEFYTKIALGALAIGVTARAMIDLRIWSRKAR